MLNTYHPWIKTEPTAVVQLLKKSTTSTIMRLETKWTWHSEVGLNNTSMLLNISKEVLGDFNIVYKRHFTSNKMDNRCSCRTIDNLPTSMCLPVTIGSYTIFLCWGRIILLEEIDIIGWCVYWPKNYKTSI